MELIIVEEMEMKCSDRQRWDRGVRKTKPYISKKEFDKNTSKNDKPINGSEGILFIMCNGVIHEIDKISENGFLGEVRWVEESTSVLYYKPFICPYIHILL